MQSTVLWITTLEPSGLTGKTQQFKYQQHPITSPHFYHNLHPIPQHLEWIHSSHRLLMVFRSRYPLIPRLPPVLHSTRLAHRVNQLPRLIHWARQNEEAKLEGKFKWVEEFIGNSGLVQAACACLLVSHRVYGCLAQKWCCDYEEAPPPSHRTYFITTCCLFILSSSI